jgi:hypothetical protein
MNQDFNYELLFTEYRGIDCETKQWRTGSLLREDQGTSSKFYIVKNNVKHKVFPLSVGIGTRELDVNEKEIFVGDIVLKTIRRASGEEFSIEKVVSFQRGIICLGNSSLGHEVTLVNKPRLEIVGNIYSCLLK